jgi:hypothetical protein
MAGKLTKSAIDAASPRDEDYFLWDGELKGFGIKIAKGGRKSYVCKYRDRQWHERRRRGASPLALTAPPGRSIRRACRGSQDCSGLQQMAGIRPRRSRRRRSRSPSQQLCDLYMENGVGTKKASTVATDYGRIERHIKPLLGRKKVRDVTRADVKRFLQEIAGGKTSVDKKPACAVAQS